MKRTIFWNVQGIQRQQFTKICGSFKYPNAVTFHWKDMLKVHTVFCNIFIFSSIKFCAFSTLRFKGLCRYESLLHDRDIH